MQISVMHQGCICFRDEYPMLVVANKVDLVHQRKISEEQGREMAARLNVSTKALMVCFFNPSPTLVLVCKCFLLKFPY